MARDNCTYYYNETISAIISMERDRKVQLNGEQCKQMIEAFKRVRYLLSRREDLRTNTKYCLLLKEIYRQTIAAIAVLESCCCCRVHEFPQRIKTKPIESWLEVAVTQSRMVFRVILDDLNWCAGLITKAAGDPSQAESSQAAVARLENFRTEIDELAIENDLTDFKKRLDDLKSVGERDELLAKFLRAALDSNDSEDVDACSWESTSSDEELKVNDLVKYTRWLGIRVVRKGFKFPDLNFEKEKEILKSLNHPNVVRYITFSKQVFTHSAIIMERVDETLEAYLGQHPHLTTLEKLDILYQIASVMAYLHENGVAHCDIKPANLLVNRCKVTGLEGYVHLKIADFGESESGETLSISKKTVRGTWTHRAPEFMRAATNVDILMKADVFSYALTCWQILYGKAPFIEGIGNLAPAKYTKAILEGKRPGFDEYVPPRLKELLERCWSREPEERPPSSEISLSLRGLIEESLLGVIPASQPISVFEYKTSRKTWKVLLSSVKALVAVQIRLPHVRVCFAKQEEEYVFTGSDHENAEYLQIIPAAINIEDRDQPAPSRFMLRTLRRSGCFTPREEVFDYPGSD